MKHWKYWVIMSIGLWVVGLILFFLSGGNNQSPVLMTASSLIAVANLIFGSFLIVNAHRFVNWSEQWYQERNIERWRGISVGDPGWNMFGVWVYRAAGSMFVVFFILFLVNKVW